MQPVDSESPSKRPFSWSRLLLLIPFVAVLWVPFYNKIEPAWFGIPFFYTYQMLCILGCCVIVLIVYKAES